MRICPALIGRTSVKYIHISDTQTMPNISMKDRSLKAPSERQAAEQLVAAVDSARCFSMAGETTMRQLLVLYCLADVLVTNDSGPMHVEAALDVPVLAIFGPGTPAKTAPYMPPDRIIALTNAYPCSPCRQDFFKECDPSPSLRASALPLQDYGTN